MATVENYLNYERLKNITQTVKPYRKSDNRFPLSYREHRHKCFFVHKDADGNDEYHIAYGQALSGHKYIEKEQLEEMKKQGHQVYEGLEDGVMKYYYYEKFWNIVGVVRSDNTFEITTNDRYLHQGMRYYLSQLFNMRRAWFISSSRHGGCLYRIQNPNQDGTYGWGIKNATIIPVFKGQKFDLNTNLAVTNYEVHIRRIDRVKDKAMLAEHEDDFKFADVMFKTMSLESFKSEVVDVYKHLFGDERYWLSQDVSNTLLQYGNEIAKTDFIRGLCAFMMGAGVGRAFNLAIDSWYGNVDDTTPYRWYSEGKKILIKRLRLANDVFKTQVYKANETYPASVWEPIIYLDGVQQKGL